MRHALRETTLLAIIAAALALMMALEPIGQSQAYHNFADQRLLFGIPNFLDVISNVPFLLFGILGARHCFENRQRFAGWSWIVFFGGVTLVSLGSGYYHLSPTNDTLVWDRLPMTIGFMGLFVALLSEYTNVLKERALLIPAVALGFASVAYWAYADDLRFYFWIQLTPLVAIPLTMTLFKSRYTHQSYLLIALGFYLLAKITEIYDTEFFAWTAQSISGHSIKHLLAGFAPLTLLLMLQRRTESPEFARPEN